MTIGITALINAVVSHAFASGHFDAVLPFEPKSAPDGDLTYAVFLSDLGPARAASGLTATSARVELTGRIYKPFMSQPEGLIDRSLADACDDLFEAYTGDLDLGGNARNVDVMGAHGAALRARASYQKLGDATYRIMDITIPIIVNDAWIQG
jgi:hypothetical protein